MKCPVAEIVLRDHPTDPNLQIGEVAGHTVVVGRHYDQNTRGFYIPVDAIVPDKLLEEMWLKGRLAGSKKNRVKARLVKEVQSEGLFYGSRYWIMKDGVKEYVESASWNPSWQVGHDVAQELGIT